eukprot:g12739.t1
MSEENVVDTAAQCIISECHELAAETLEAKGRGIIMSRKLESLLDELLSIADRPDSLAVRFFSKIANVALKRHKDQDAVKAITRLWVNVAKSVHGLVFRLHSHANLWQQLFALVQRYLHGWTLLSTISHRLNDSISARSCSKLTAEMTQSVTVEDLLKKFHPKCFFSGLILWMVDNLDMQNSFTPLPAQDGKRKNAVINAVSQQMVAFRRNHLNSDQEKLVDAFMAGWGQMHQIKFLLLQAEKRNDSNRETRLQELKGQQAYWIQVIDDLDTNNRNSVRSWKEYAEEGGEEPEGLQHPNKRLDKQKLESSLMFELKERYRAGKDRSLSQTMATEHTIYLPTITQKLDRQSIAAAANQVLSLTTWQDPAGVRYLPCVMDESAWAAFKVNKTVSPERYKMLKPTYEPLHTVFCMERTLTHLFKDQGLQCLEAEIMNTAQAAKMTGPKGTHRTVISCLQVVYEVMVCHFFALFAEQRHQVSRKLLLSSNKSEEQVQKLKQIANALKQPTGRAIWREFMQQELSRRDPTVKFWWMLTTELLPALFALPLSYRIPRGDFVLYLAAMKQLVPISTKMNHYKYTTCFLQGTMDIKNWDETMRRLWVVRGAWVTASRSDWDYLGLDECKLVRSSSICVQLWTRWKKIPRILNVVAPQVQQFADFIIPETEKKRSKQDVRLNNHLPTLLAFLDKEDFGSKLREKPWCIGRPGYLPQLEADQMSFEYIRNEGIAMLNFLYDSMNKIKWNFRLWSAVRKRMREKVLRGGVLTVAIHDKKATAATWQKKYQAALAAGQKTDDMLTELLARGGDGSVAAVKKLCEDGVFEPTPWSPFLFQDRGILLEPRTQNKQSIRTFLQLTGINVEEVTQIQLPSNTAVIALKAEDHLPTHWTGEHKVSQIAERICKAWYDIVPKGNKAVNLLAICWDAQDLPAQQNPKIRTPTQQSETKGLAANECPLDLHQNIKVTDIRDKPEIRKAFLDLLPQYLASHSSLAPKRRESCALVWLRHTRGIFSRADMPEKNLEVGRTQTRHARCSNEAMVVRFHTPRTLIKLNPFLHQGF